MTAKKYRGIFEMMSKFGGWFKDKEEVEAKDVQEARTKIKSRIKGHGRIKNLKITKI